MTFLLDGWRVFRYADNGIGTLVKIQKSAQPHLVATVIVVVVIWGASVLAKSFLVPTAFGDSTRVGPLLNAGTDEDSLL